MRYNPEHKQKTYDKVLKEAMLAIRKNGSDIGIPKLMSKVGLTHGGFYAHFKSKEDLINVAIEKMFLNRMEMLKECLNTDDALSGLENYIDKYLSEKHRTHPELGCPAAALITEISRMPASTQLVFEQGMDLLLLELSNAIKQLSTTSNPAELATILLTEMIGCMTFARVIQNEERAKQVLATTRHHLKTMLQQLS